MLYHDQYHAQHLKIRAEKRRQKALEKAKFWDTTNVFARYLIVVTVKELLALDIFWYSIWQFMVNFGDTSKEVFLDYVGRELGFESIKF